MTTAILPPLIFLELLADRKRTPAASMLKLEASQADFVPALAEHPDFRAMTAMFPCFIDPGVAASLPPSVAGILESAGCRRLAETSILRADDRIAPTLSPGIQWVAGTWYLSPPTKASGNQAVSRALALQLVQLVATDADTYEIESVFRRDPSLSYHLLRIVNSLAMGTNRQITSFSQAILILGRQQLRRWLNLLLFSARAGDERSAMLLARVAVRARLMELLAKACGRDKAGQDQAFMAGMFSLLGVLFGLPLAEVLQPLKIGDELLAALLEQQGDLGRLLTLVGAAERGDAAAVSGVLDALPLPAAEFNLLTIQAYVWMQGVIRDGQGNNGNA